MKNKLIILINIIMLIFCANTYTYAANKGIVYIESNEDIIEKGEEIELTINLKDTKTGAFSISIYYDELKFEYVSNIENTNVIEDRVMFVWHDDTGGLEGKEGELIKLKFRAKDEGLATFNVQGEFYNAKEELIEIDFKEKQIQIGREQTKLEKQLEEEQGTNTEISNAKLKDLRLDIEGTHPVFNSDVYEYYLTTEENIKDIEVLAIAQNPNSTVNINGNKELKKGLNKISIEVISEDNSEKNIYNINVTKTDNIELSNTNLEILAIENILLNVPFDVNQVNYKAEIANDKNSINILAIPENEQSVVEINGKDNLKEGNNLVTILVTSPDKISNKKYQIEVYKRNIEDEKKYIEEQNTNQKLLENAYKIEKIKLEDENINQNEKSKTNKYIWIIFSIVIICAVVAIIFTLLHFKGNYKFLKKK